MTVETHKKIHSVDFIGFVLQGIASENKVINVVAGFEALDDIATATLVFNRMCGTGSWAQFIVSCISVI